MRHNRETMRLVFGDLIITKGVVVITQEMLSDFATLSSIHKALVDAANAVVTQQFGFVPNTGPWNEHQDRYQDLLYAANTTTILLSALQRDIRNRLAVDLATTMVETLTGYGIANPRPLNSPLDPNEPIIMSTEREWVANAIIEQLRKQ